MEDRLAELGGSGHVETNDVVIEVDTKKGKKDKGKKNADVELDNVEGGNEFMNDFFQDVGSIKATMGNIRRNIKAIEEKYMSSLTAISIDQGNKVSAEIQQIIDETGRMSQEVRSRLENLKVNNEAYAKSKSATPTELRIRQNMQGTLTQKFVELMQEYQEVQTDYKNKYKDRMVRQYKIVKPEASPDEIDEAIESGDSSKVFVDQIMDTHLHTQAKNALAYIQDRHRDILRLEQSIRELHQLFVDMSILVAAQGEMLDQIEYNVTQSVAYTTDGVEQLRQANTLQKKSRKKMIILVVILIIIIIVVLAPVLTTTLKKQNSNTVGTPS
eukprot:TRINITY_DN3115_c2_g1_i1.p1 TRINITY_DN3115_c2_g1~~TRINITY_DN3115_c2_g1_i1.p1  ORF type:complete len:328 (+),score=65.95 TRINITY_DN3115_c2_g1_i1:111-1094(+)